LKSDMFRFLEILEDFGQTEPLLLYRGTVEMVLNLMGPESQVDPTIKSMIRVGSTRLSAGGYLLTVPQNASARALQYYYRQQMALAYYFDDFVLAEEMSSNLSSPLADGPVAWLPPRFFFQGLVLLARAKEKTTSKHKRRLYLKRGTTFYNKLEKIASDGNVNCQHLVLILGAEIVSLNHYSNKKRVQEEYDNAIAKSGRRGFLNDQALANQRAGEYVLQQGDKDWAATYLNRARDLYIEWGALAKARQLEDKYVNLLEQGVTESKRNLQRGSGFKARMRLDDIRVTTHRAHISMIAFQV
jgi:hypothetical protein